MKWQFRHSTNSNFQLSSINRLDHCIHVRFSDPEHYLAQKTMEEEVDTA